MSDSQIKRGMIFYGDVLGYQNLIAGERIEDAAKVIDDLLLIIPGEVTMKMVKSLLAVDSTAGAVISSVVIAADWRVISDSIIMTLPFPASDGTDWLWTLVSVGLVRGFAAKMIESGLPIRGAISFGTYFVSDRSFAGKPFVRAYKASIDLDWAGVVLLDEASHKFEDDKITEQNIFALKFCVPAKHNSNESKYCINWPAALDQSLHPRQFLLESFLKHGKTWSPKLITKLTNTEAFMTYSHMATVRPK